VTQVPGAVQSARGAAAMVVLLAGVAVALAVAILIGEGAEAIIHIVLGLGFALLALAVFDFRLPAWITIAAAIGIALLAAIFLLQAASDLTHAPPLTYLAFDLLGQRLEKILGYVFLLWCLALVGLDSRGWRRGFGFAVLAVVVAVEGYSTATVAGGGEASAALKLLYLPVFGWLLLESLRPSLPAGTGPVENAGSREKRAA
jgi:hypothetical protein